MADAHSLVNLPDHAVLAAQIEADGVGLNLQGPGDPRDALLCRGLRGSWMSGT
jgi:hypothetical protein